MKASPFNPWRRGRGNPPLRTFRELAEQYGVTVPQLRGMFRTLPGRPEPRVVHNYRSVDGVTTNQNSWYDQKEFRDWLEPVLDPSTGTVDLATYKRLTTLNKKAEKCT